MTACCDTVQTNAELKAVKALLLSALVVSAAGRLRRHVRTGEGGGQPEHGAAAGEGSARRHTGGAGVAAEAAAGGEGPAGGAARRVPGPGAGRHSADGGQPGFQGRGWCDSVHLGLFHFNCLW